MDNATFHRREAIAATVRSVVVDLADACEALYQKGYTMAYTQAKRDDMATLRAFNAALLAGEYDSPAINSGIEVLVIRGVSETFMQDAYSFLGLETPENSVEWNDDLSLADNIKANIREQEKTPEPYVQGIICNDIVEEIPAQKENTTMLNVPKVAIIDMLNTDYSNADESCYMDALAIARDILIKGLYDDEVQFMAKQFLGDREVQPKEYIIRNDGFFGEWNLWLDDTLGTIIGNGYESKDAAIKAAWQHKDTIPKGYTVTGLQDTDYKVRRWVYDTPEGVISEGIYDSKDAAIMAAWQHKENQSKGDTMNTNISIYDAKTSEEFTQGAKNLAYDIANQQSFTEIVDALIADGIESISEVFQQCWDNYTCYSPFEVVMSAINGLGEDESAECWDSIQDAVQEVFESVADEVLQGVKSELQERIEDAEDSFTTDDEQIDDMLDSSQDAFMIGDMEFLPSDILKSCDPIAYNEVKAEYVSFMIDEDEDIQALVTLLNNVTT